MPATKSEALVLSLKTAFFLALAIAVVNGFARFAYALILPVMRADLQWDYALSGWLNTANSLGYALGGLSGMLLLARYTPSTLFVTGLISTVISLLLVGFTSDFYLMLFWRLLAGVGSAWVFACGGSLVSAFYSKDPERAGSAIAIYFAGGGLGIALSGIVIYPVLSGGMTWSMAWITLAGVGALLAVLPVVSALGVSHQQTKPSPEKFATRRYLPIICSYVLFGVGYIIYMTFVIAWLKEMRVGVLFSAGMWVVVGVGAMASGFIWRRAMAIWWPTRTYALATFTTGLGSLLPLLSNSELSLLISGFMVGGSFFMVPAAIAVLIRKTLPQTLWAKALNVFTMLFALGQAIGPVVAGWIADTVGLNTAMLCGAVILFFSAALSFLQPKPA
jgi:predicted MFS family arabinose efflux permease